MRFRFYGVKSDSSIYLSNSWSISWSLFEAGWANGRWWGSNWRRNLLLFKYMEFIDGALQRSELLIFYAGFTGAIISTLVSQMRLRTFRIWFAFLGQLFWFASGTNFHKFEFTTLKYLSLRRLGTNLSVIIYGGSRSVFSWRRRIYLYRLNFYGLTFPQSHPGSWRNLLILWIFSFPQINSIVRVRSIIFWYSDRLCHRILGFISAIISRS